MHSRDTQVTLAPTHVSKFVSWWVIKSHFRIANLWSSHYFRTTSALLLHNFCTTSALLLYNFCITSALLLHYFPLLLHYFCTASALFLHYFYTTSTQILHYFCNTSAIICTTSAILLHYLCTSALMHGAYTCIFPKVYYQKGISHIWIFAKWYLWNFYCPLSFVCTCRLCWKSFWWPKCIFGSVIIQSVFLRNTPYLRVFKALRVYSIGSWAPVQSSFPPILY